MTTYHIHLHPIRLELSDAKDIWNHISTGISYCLGNVSQKYKIVPYSINNLNNNTSPRLATVGAQLFKVI